MKKASLFTLYMCSAVMSAQAGTATITLNNATSAAYLSFKVASGKHQGQCLNQVVPEYEFFSRPGSQYINISTDDVNNKICAGASPCILDFYLGQSPCAGTKWGSVQIQTEESEPPHLNFILRGLDKGNKHSGKTISVEAGKDMFAITETDLGGKPKPAPKPKPLPKDKR